MTRFLCTFPGKSGDILWALPAIRARSRRIGAPVDLTIAAPFAALAPLIAQQPYIASCHADPYWEVQDTAPMTPRIPPRPPAPTADQRTLHLGYRGWPTRPLPFETLDGFNEARAHDGTSASITDDELDLGTPWIRLRYPPTVGPELVIAFTPEHFELKFGLTVLALGALMRRRFGTTYTVLTTPGSRWTQEASHLGLHAEDWYGYASWLSHAKVALCCNSGAHVLAVAMGVPVVMMEPNPMRHHAIFYPLGQDGPQVTLVKGTDGLPTFDARHVTDALLAALERTPR